MPEPIGDHLIKDGKVGKKNQKNDKVKARLVIQQDQLYFPSRHTTSFQRLYDLYTTSLTSYRRRIDVETTSCVYWVVCNW